MRCRDALYVVGTLGKFLCCKPTTAIGMIWQWMGVGEWYANTGVIICCWYARLLSLRQTNNTLGIIWQWMGVGDGMITRAEK